jgi:hypothetical protein
MWTIVKARMNAEAKPRWIAGVDKAALLAIVTPIAYFFAYQYDRGYLSFFGIPNVFVDVSLRDLLIVAAAMVTVVVGLYVAFDGFLVVLPEKWPKPIRQRAIWFFWTMAALTLLDKVFDLSVPVWLSVEVSIALLFIFLVVLPGRRSPVSLAVEHTSQPSNPDPYAHKGVIPTMLRRGFEPRLVFGILGAMLVGVFANVGGDVTARTQTSFLVDQSGGTNCAVIRMRESDMLCADFNFETRQLTGDYHFLKLEGASLSLRKTGRLEQPELIKYVGRGAPK